MKKKELNVLQTPFCGELRSKKFYLHDAIATSVEDYMDNSGHIFCYQTQMTTGPDGQAVHPEVCRPGRSCYRSALAEPQAWEPLLLKPLESENPEV